MGFFALQILDYNSLLKGTTQLHTSIVVSQPEAGPGGFMAYGDLWGSNLIVWVFYKSSLGFMGIYITGGLSIIIDRLAGKIIR